MFAHQCKERFYLFEPWAPCDDTGVLVPVDEPCLVQFREMDVEESLL
ncbi:hypothetical protein ACFQJ5_08385 [Halomicroarcula sp. GCM10025324]|nr:hypothetical protein [Halomicroarcula sp. ZS-22-S1]